MSQDLIGAVTALAERLVIQALHDDGLWEDLRAVARAVLVETERPPLLVTPEPDQQFAGGEEPGRPGPELPPTIEEEQAVTTAMAEVARTARLPELTLGRSMPSEFSVCTEPNVMTTKCVTTDADLPAIEARCRLKAEGVRWAATRRRRIGEGAVFRDEIRPRDREIFNRARDLHCNPWMNRPSFTIPREPSLLDDVAGCFDAVAESVPLVRGMLTDLDTNRELFEPALDLVAEAQSALRVAIDRIDGPKDQEQFRVYDWLCGVASREQIYIRRHMSLDDPAEPALFPQIQDRIKALNTRLQKVQQRAKKKKSDLNRVRYHAKLIAEGTGSEHDWRKVAGAIDEMVGEGVPASSMEVRELLLPILDDMPDLDGLPPGFGLVLREIDRYLAGRMTVAESTTPSVPTPEVAEAARLLSSRCMVLIGGDRRPDAYEALKTALGLNELLWIETRKHESIHTFEPYVARTEVAVVLLAIRWSSHSFGEVKGFCDLYNKPMVRLPGGYNPNQVAAQILAQCSGKLGG